MVTSCTGFTRSLPSDEPIAKRPGGSMTNSGQSAQSLNTCPTCADDGSRTSSETAVTANKVLKQGIRHKLAAVQHSAVAILMRGLSRKFTISDLLPNLSPMITRLPAVG